MCEIFGAFGWAEGTKYMKYLADHMLVRGVNYYVPHAFSPKPNDLDCPPNFYQSGENAQFKYFRNIMDYMNRVCHLHNGGIHIPTAAIVYDAEAQWVGRERLPLEKVGKALYDNLLDYDILPHEMLPEIDAEGCLNGETYPCVILPYYEGIPETVLQSLSRVKIPVIVAVKPGMTVKEDLLKAKAAIVELGDLPGYVRTHIGSDVTADYSGIFLRYYHYLRSGVVDGQVLVMHDMLGITQGFSPRFLRRYADVFSVITEAVGNYVADVKSGDFPNEKEQY